MARSFIRWTAFAEGAVTSVACAGLVLGALVPQLGWLSVAGATLVPIYTLWFCVLALVSATPALLAIRLGLAAGVAPGGVSLLACTGSVVILAGMLQLSASSGANVDLLASLSFSGLDRSLPDQTQVYLTEGDRSLRIDIYLPPIPANAGGSPVLLYVHGGGWYQGDRAAGSSDLRWYAGQGFVVLSPDYTLATNTVHPWDLVDGEVGCAMAWTAAHAASLNADMSRFAMSGDSAGGTLAINAAYAANQDIATSSCGGPVPHVAAVVAASPILDPLGTWSNTTVQGDAARFILRQYTGGSPQQFPDRYRAISCFTYVSANAPPTLILNGANDHLVPHQGSVDFVRAARAGGVDVSLVVVPYADHSFDLTFGAIGHQVKLQLFERFLGNHLGA